MEEQQFTPEAKNSVRKDTAKTASIPRDVKLKLQKHLNKQGYSQQVLLDASKHQNRNYSNAVLQYVATTIGRSEEMVTKCDSVSLNNITQWLELMKSCKLAELCEFEAAAAVNSIIQNETMPSPEELSGIDLNEAYKFMENALMGQPQKKMSDATEAFLSKEIELLIKEANTDESDDVARSMGQRLYDHQSLDYREQRQKCSLDPLFLDEKPTSRLEGN